MLDKLPPHVLDNIREHLPKNRAIKLSQINSTMETYVHRLNKLKIEHNSVCIVKNRYCKLEHFDQCLMKRKKLRGKRFLRFMSTKRLFYWESDIFEKVDHLPEFLQNIEEFSFDSKNIEDICKYIRMMPNLKTLEIMNKKIEELDAIAVLEAIQINDQEQFNLKLNRQMKVTKNIIDAYLTKCHGLKVRNLYYGKNKYPGGRGTKKPKTLEGLLHFLTSDNLCQLDENVKELPQRARLEIGRLDLDSIKHISNHCKEVFGAPVVVLHRNNLTYNEIYDFDNIGSKTFFVRTTFQSFSFSALFRFIFRCDRR